MWLLSLSLFRSYIQITVQQLKLHTYEHVNYWFDPCSASQTYEQQKLVELIATESSGLRLLPVSAKATIFWIESHD